MSNQPFFISFFIVSEYIVQGTLSWCNIGDIVKARWDEGPWVFARLLQREGRQMVLLVEEDGYPRVSIKVLVQHAQAMDGTPCARAVLCFFGRVGNFDGTFAEAGSDSSVLTFSAPTVRTYLIEENPEFTFDVIAQTWDGDLVPNIETVYQPLLVEATEQPKDWFYVAKGVQCLPNATAGESYLIDAAFHGNLEEAKAMALLVGGTFFTKFKGWLRVSGCGGGLLKDMTTNSTAELYAYMLVDKVQSFAKAHERVVALKTEVERRGAFTYDIVVLIRYDVFFKQPLRLEKPARGDQNLLWAGHWCTVNAHNLSSKHVRNSLNLSLAEVRMARRGGVFSPMSMSWHGMQDLLFIGSSIVMDRFALWGLFIEEHRHKDATIFHSGHFYTRLYAQSVGIEIAFLGIPDVDYALVRYRECLIDVGDQLWGMQNLFCTRVRIAHIGQDCNDPHWGVARADERIQVLCPLSGYRAVKLPGSRCPLYWGFN